MKKFFKKTEGFTLVELIVVIAILGILAGVGTVGYSGYVNKAKQAADEQLLAALNQAYTAACMENGEYDMKNLSVNPEITSNIQESIVMKDYNDAFQKYYAGGGAFKYFDKLFFVKSEGVFKGNTVAAIEEALKKAVEGTPFDDEDVMETMLESFDLIGYYFSGDDPAFPGGFSLDKLLAGAPADIRDAFNFGTFDLTDEEILERYVDGYAGMNDADRAAWKAANADKIPAIKGNAYVLRFANDAAGSTVAGIMGDLNNMFAELTTPASDDEVLEYYKLNFPGAASDATVEEAKTKIEMCVPGTGLTAHSLVALATSGVKNTSGISTLGSMYALAAGFYSNSAYYDQNKTKPNFANFNEIYTGANGVMSPQNYEAFTRYLNEQAEKDIDAYLNAMSYLSTGNFDMANGNMFSSDGLGYILDALK